MSCRAHDEALKIQYATSRARAAGKSWGGRPTHSSRCCVVVLLFSRRVRHTFFLLASTGRGFVNTHSIPLSQHDSDSHRPPHPPPLFLIRRMASSSSQSPPPEPHHLQDDDDAVLSSLLLDLGRGYDGEQEVEDEQDVEALAVESAPAQAFDARAYHQLASEYYAQPLLLTGGELTVAQWPKLRVGEEGTRTLLQKVLDSCRVCRVTIPPLVVEEEGKEEADGKKKPRLATLQEKEIEVRALLRRVRE